jgi:NADH-quinone oxidoreductase subunit J
MAVVLMGGFRLTEAQALTAAELKLGNSKLLGFEIYTQYLYPLQVAAVLLLVAIIAAIALTLRRRKDSRQIDVSQQLRARKADRVRLVKMPPVIELPSASRSEGAQS